MKKKDQFVTILYWARNVDLVKMTGQIPYFMHLHHGFDSTLVTYRVDESYPYLRNEVKGLKIHFLEKIGRLGPVEKAVVKYIAHRSKDIAILNLYHYTLETMIYGILYKFFNPKGFLYIELDDDLSFLQRINSLCGYPVNPFKKLLFRSIEFFFIKLSNLFVIESRLGLQLIRNRAKKISRKTIYSPYGIDFNYILKHFPNVKTFDDKEDIIITVGRIGTFQKNNEMLLEALKHVDLKSWSVYFIGPIENNFKENIAQFYAENSMLKEKIVFLGEISDRYELYKWFDKAKIFCLTSRNESFGIVLAEALHFGNYILTTNVITANDVTNNGELGTIINHDDIGTLSKKINELISNSEIIRFKQQAIIEHARKNFVWDKIVENLDAKIKREKGQYE